MIRTIRVFLAKCASARCGGSKMGRQVNLHSTYTKFKSNRYFKPNTPRKPGRRHQGEVKVTQDRVSACSSSLGIELSFLSHLNTLSPAGRIQFCTSNWESISDDPWILGVVLACICSVAEEFTPQPSCQKKWRSCLQSRR